MKKFDSLVFVCRAQPLHRGHTSVIDRALELADQVIICVGSSFEARTPRNPFTFQERAFMIQTLYGDLIGYDKATGKKFQRVVAVPILDYPYDDQKWIYGIQKKVKETAIGNRIGLIGHSKDSTSYYLQIFPDWGSVEVPNYKNINATDLRELLFNGQILEDDEVDPEIRVILDDLTSSNNWIKLEAEYRMIKAYKEVWEVAPYPPTFVTTDAVVVQSGHVLMVRRGAAPGKGLWALPGGFLNQEETLLDGCIRELREETKLKVPVPVLKGSVKDQRTFDHPNRSLRGRTITTAFHIVLPNGDLPKVKGSDDADLARWIPLGELDREVCFEDHFAIISHFTGIE